MLRTPPGREHYVCIFLANVTLLPHTTKPNEPQIRAYSACIAAKLEGAQGVERGACEAEFSAVRACFQQQLKAGRGAGKA